jgi:predicted O-linked N-acetylglucosamine transferase (SPINDLY family)
MEIDTQPILPVGLLLPQSQQAYQCLLREDYNQAATLYERDIEANPTYTVNYWYLGLTRLLQGEETEAQTIWFSVLLEAESEQVEEWTAELVQVLETEAQRRAALEDYQIAWVIRQHIREIVPNDSPNLLHLIKLCVQLELLFEQESILCQATEQLQASTTDFVDENLLQDVLKELLDFAPELNSVIDFVGVYVERAIHYSSLAQVFLNQTAVLLQQEILPKRILSQYAELYLKLQPENLPILVNLINLYHNTQRYSDSLRLSEQFIARAVTLPNQVAAYYLYVRNLMECGGNFDRAYLAHQKYEESLLKLIEHNFDPQTESYQNHIVHLIATVVFRPYVEDNPLKFYQIRQKSSAFLQDKLRDFFKNNLTYLIDSLPQNINRGRKIKIGYLSSCLRRNSVGHLTRWTFQHHDRDRFEVYAYSLKRTNDEIQQFISAQFDYFKDVSLDPSVPELAELIYQDEIDILVDLDSLTFSLACAVMALKPAPIQVTWLGFDASEIPAIDYFIADPYVLPDTAQDYYSETIWRLPQTYIAVDGFEVGVPTLRREQLEIPTNAVVYFSSQTGAKRHPDNVRLQMRILKEVPNSYFLIKGLYTDVESVKRFFEEIAAEEGVKFERLRFLSDVPSEAVHRANLAISDVVLDTYPYNGTTTTLETLWMGVPVVTRVGEQFASRQGYTLLMNVGVTEGIAWTDEQYVEWGVRLGKDAALRQEVAWKLRMSRHHAPLWNAEKFTRDLEDAYRQMWEMYLKSQR